MRIFSILIIVFVLGFGSQYGALAGAPDAYVPGLGEFMAAIQLRHAKLWFAGKAKNWQLAAYELDELREVFEDAAKYQPEFKGKPIAELIGQVTNEPMASLEKAIRTKDATGFAKALDQLSAACTSCHQSTGYGFISIQRPVSPPLTNQRFDLRPSPDQRAHSPQQKQQ